ncbi:peptide ABC transporter substrate-binding protein [Solibacillus sp. A46]|uniref:Peptide ABC transporter substrate-binding protein n=1 Tax=Solibacillus faecavium TaxID=2762221 RepID=A0ABR8XW44_9BACL|nr:peptide ABC transporter substrate-binding protein [Solibacillus faecavium]MBD8036140.1 peptide ABC transporter substrate-binding protein [Solibacillus faecavium]
MKKWLSLLLLSLLTIVLVACTANEETESKDSEEKPAENAETESTDEEKVLYLNNANEPTSFDPSIGFDSVSWDPLNNLMEGLVRLDKNLEPKEAMAEKYEISEDGLTYTFTLRDAEWTNGDPVTAGDFVYGWLHMLNPETASYSAFLGTGYIEGAQAYNEGTGDASGVAIKAIDEKTFEVKLISPFDGFLAMITLPTFFPVNEKVATATPDWFANADTFVGNGPFKLETWSHEEKMTFVKNDTYWDKDSVKLDRVEWAMVNDTNTSYQMYQTGELDVTGIPSNLADTLLDDPEAIVYDMAGTHFYRFNVTKEPFTNKKIRQAFSYAINAQEIVDYVVKTGNKVADGFVAYGFKGPDGKDFRETQGSLIGFDADKAKQLLEEGMAEEGWDTLPAVELSYNTSDVLKSVAETMQSQLKQVLGVDVTIQNSEWAVFREEQVALNLQFSRSTFGHDYADPINALENFTSDNDAMNRTGWKNPQFDELIKKARAEVDAQTRWNYLLDAEKILIEDAPLVPLYFYNGSVLQKSNVTDIVRPAVGSIELKYADKK